MVPSTVLNDAKIYFGKQEQPAGKDVQHWLASEEGVLKNSFKESA